MGRFWGRAIEGTVGDSKAPIVVPSQRISAQGAVLYKASPPAPLGLDGARERLIEGVEAFHLE